MRKKRKETVKDKRERENLKEGERKEEKEREKNLKKEGKRKKKKEEMLDFFYEIFCDVNNLHSYNFDKKGIVWLC